MRKMLLLLILVSAACSTGDTTVSTTTTFGDEPVAVVEQWLAAVAVSDAEELGRLVEPVGLAVVAGVENDLRSDELVALLASGFSPALAIRYWGTFRNDFEAIRDMSLTSLRVGEASDIAGHPGFVAVEIASPEAAGLVILRRSGAPGWQVDVAATVGPALIGPLTNYLDSALTGPNAALIGEAYRQGILPALDAAVSADPGNSDLAFEAEYIRQLLNG